MSRVLALFPRTRGLVWGAYGEASSSVHALLAHAALVGAEQQWRAIGARSAAEAGGFLVASMRRAWGVQAVLAQARLVHMYMYTDMCMCMYVYISMHLHRWRNASEHGVQLDDGTRCIKLRPSHAPY